MKRLALLILAALPAIAADSPYRQGELSVSPFVSASTSNFEQFKEGYGVSVSYAYRRCWVVEARARHSGWDNSGQLIQDAGARVIGRYPVPHMRWAPYAYVGAGWDFLGETTRIETGIGLDRRLTDRISAYVEAGHVSGFRGDNYYLGSAGVKWTF
jgi:outer membrane autotransporter protein